MDMQINDQLQFRVAEQTNDLIEANRKLTNAHEELRVAAVAFQTSDSIMITDTDPGENFPRIIKGFDHCAKIGLRSSHHQRGSQAMAADIGDQGPNRLLRRVKEVKGISAHVFGRMHCTSNIKPGAPEKYLETRS